MFFWTTLDGLVLSIEIILWDTSYFRFSNNIQIISYSSYLVNKEQNLMFLF